MIIKIELTLREYELAGKAVAQAVERSILSYGSAHQAMMVQSMMTTLQEKLEKKPKASMKLKLPYHLVSALETAINMLDPEENEQPTWGSLLMKIQPEIFRA